MLFAYERCSTNQDISIIKEANECYSISDPLLYGPKEKASTWEA
jgi:hypothetical protein